jgi:putative ABC transport system substrate-binding protein
MIRRRDFITLLGGSAAAWPLTARAQQRAMPVIGFLHYASSEAYAPNAAKFAQGLREGGFVEGQNVAIEYRWAESQSDALPTLAADLVRRQVAVIVAGGGSVAAAAAKFATSTTPIVFVVGDDPVKAGLADSLSRPGGTVTGVTFFSVELVGKRLGLLHDLVPRVTTIAYLEPTPIESSRSEVVAAASAFGWQVVFVSARSERDFDGAFDAMIEHRVGALVVAVAPLFASYADKVVALAARYKIPTIYQRRADAVAGGLMSYGTDIPEAWRRGAAIVGKILKGARPADLPIERSTKFEFVINLKTARTLGVTVPPDLLSIADEVIE